MKFLIKLFSRKKENKLPLNYGNKFGYFVLEAADQPEEELIPATLPNDRMQRLYNQIPTNEQRLAMLQEYEKGLSGIVKELRYTNIEANIVGAGMIMFIVSIAGIIIWGTFFK